MKEKESAKMRLEIQLSSIMERVDNDTYSVKTLGKKIATVSFIKPKSQQCLASELGLKSGDLVLIDTARMEAFAIYVGKGPDPDSQDSADQHWFLAESDPGIHYYGGLQRESDLQKFGIKKRMLQSC